MANLLPMIDHGYGRDANRDKLRIGIIIARNEQRVVQRLLANVIEQLTALGIPEDSLLVDAVPECFLLPMAVRSWAELDVGMKGEGTNTWREPRLHAVIVLGCVVNHSEISSSKTVGNVDAPVADTVLKELAVLQMRNDIPVVPGLLVSQSAKQTQEWGDKKNSMGKSWANAAAEMGFRRRKEGEAKLEAELSKRPDEALQPGYLFQTDAGRP